MHTVFDFSAVENDLRDIIVILGITEDDIDSAIDDISTDIKFFISSFLTFIKTPNPIEKCTIRSIEIETRDFDYSDTLVSVISQKHTTSIHLDIPLFTELSILIEFNLNTQGLNIDWKNIIARYSLSRDWPAFKRKERFLEWHYGKYILPYNTDDSNIQPPKPH